MIEVIFGDGIDEVRTDPLNQWDINQKLTISGIDTTKYGKVQQVHFFNRFSEKAIRRVAYEVSGKYEVSVPNRILEEKYDIRAVIYFTNYESATVTESTKGTYYTRKYISSLDCYEYTAVNLPDNYVTGVAYFKQSGTTVKRIIIPVIPRAKPCDCIDREDPTDAELIDELLAYCNTLGVNLDTYAKIVEEYRKNPVLRVVSREEYEAMVEAGTVESNVLYCIENEDTVDAIIDEAVNTISAGITGGSIPVGKVEEAVYAESANHAASASSLDEIDIVNEDGWQKIRKNGFIYIIALESSNNEYAYYTIDISRSDCPTGERVSVFFNGEESYINEGILEVAVGGVFHTAFAGNVNGVNPVMVNVLYDCVQVGKANTAYSSKLLSLSSIVSDDDRYVELNDNLSGLYVVVVKYQNSAGANCFSTVLLPCVNGFAVTYYQDDAGNTFELMYNHNVPDISIMQKTPEYSNNHNHTLYRIYKIADL